MNTHNTSLYNELHKKLGKISLRIKRDILLFFRLTFFSNLILGLVTALNENQASSNLPDVAAGTAAGNANGIDRSTNSIVGNAASVREWIEVRNKKAALKLEKLDTDLKNYKSNSIKVGTIS